MKKTLGQFNPLINQTKNSFFILFSTNIDAFLLAFPLDGGFKLGAFRFFKCFDQIVPGRVGSFGIGDSIDRLECLSGRNLHCDTKWS